jgi:hypothetical protein
MRFLLKDEGMMHGRVGIIESHRPVESTADCCLSRRTAGDPLASHPYRLSHSVFLLKLETKTTMDFSSVQKVSSSFYYITMGIGQIA